MRNRRREAAGAGVRSGVVVLGKTDGLVSRGVTSFGCAAGLVKSVVVHRAALSRRIWRCSPAGADYTSQVAEDAGTGRSSKMQACSSARIRQTASGHRASQLQGSIGVAESLSASTGLPPLTSSSFEVVSSKLVTLPLGPIQN